MSYEVQDPDETLDWSFDWTDWLDGDTMATSAWSITPAGPQLAGEGIAAGVIATAFVGGVVFGQVYELVNTVTTAAGRTGERSYFIRACQR